jgi:hypothetical protein
MSVYLHTALTAEVHLAYGEWLEGQQYTEQFISVQFFAYFRTELDNQLPVTESPRIQNSNNKTTHGQNKKTKKQK